MVVDTTIGFFVFTTFSMSLRVLRLKDEAIRLSKTVILGLDPRIQSFTPPFPWVAHRSLPRT